MRIKKLKIKLFHKIKGKAVNPFNRRKEQLIPFDTMTLTQKKEYIDQMRIFF